MTILESAQKMEPHLSELREEFHRHPEAAFEEKETSALIAAELRKIGSYQITENICGHGILAEIHGSKPGKAVALRADMDALQITEETGLPFCSQTPGMMHACGHDNHITMLLGAAHLLAQFQDQISGTVRLIFQPAEELSPKGGSRSMIEAGALKGIDAIFGLHVWPGLPLGTFGVKAGPLMAASDHFYVKIHGKSGHAATPEAGIDSLLAGAQFVTAAQSIISRNTDPLKSAVISIGTFKAGTRYNIIAEDCALEGTCRTFDPDVRDLAERRLGEVLKGICTLSQCTGELDYERGYMAVNNDAAMSDYVHKTAASLFGAEKSVLVPHPSMCAEDFAFYLDHVPGAFAWIGTAKEGDPSWPLHSSHFTANEDILWRGAALLASLALNFKG